ncbi:hypothetical protein GCM10009718_09770 [Isoptericola halotolerans]|uniref:Uncharacterized protein n=1 Tax=Isoptericola halotolerans TaxID=300560 RepID=A0ABX1ZZR9_9MICO|nr:hypothetical protein [Isoptericola halotolerans]NOV96100.1 hypothetical protein [Isoptericola halotolerans]
MVDQRPGYMSPGFRTPGDKVHQRKSRAATVRRRKIGVVVALVVIAAVAVVTAFVWPGFARQGADPQPDVTVTAAPPTPTAEPVDLPGDATAFLSAMPGSVLQLVRLEPAEDTELVEDADAVEAWAVTYGDGSTGGEQVELRAGQWADADAAEQVHSALLAAAGDTSADGDVLVDGEVVGTYALTTGSPAGTSVVTWRNGTAVFEVRGPDRLVQDFYQAFPL